MKRSEMIAIIRQVLAETGIYSCIESHSIPHPDMLNEDAERILSEIEKTGLQPSKYVNPKAIEEFGDIIKEKGEVWGFIHYIDKYPEHHFLYEYYLEGWEEEDETK